MKYRFQDNTLPFEERAKDLLSRLTREEKVGMITSQLDDIPRLGIKKTHIGTEIARGVVNRDQKRETTILPQPWGMAAMFDDALMEQLGDMAGDETRITHDMEERPSSLELFGPTIDMERDPRWGRNEEAYGEDPCLTGKMSAAYCRGLTGKDEKYLKTAPLLKHFYANNYENERQTTNANITPRLKHEYYLKAFEPAVREGRAPGLMTAYNCINGVEGVNNPDVSEICKKEWGMTFAVSDGGDFGQNVAAHRTYENHAQSMGDILGVGADMMLDSRSMVDPAVREALEKGYLTEENLDKAVYSTLLLRFKLGDFDEDHPYAHIDPAKLASPAHKALAVKAAKESVILLENRGMLPLTDDGKCTVAVVGPLANENYTSAGTAAMHRTKRRSSRASEKSSAKTAYCSMKALTVCVSAPKKPESTCASPKTARYMPMPTRTPPTSLSARIGTSAHGRCAACAPASTSPRTKISSTRPRRTKTPSPSTLA